MLTEVLLLALATLAILRAWFQGSIFARRRLFAEMARDAGGWLGTLLSCPLCLSYHVAFWVGLTSILPEKLYHVTSWVEALMSIPVFLMEVLAAAAIAQSLGERLEPRVKNN